MARMTPSDPSQPQMAVADDRRRRVQLNRFSKHLSRQGLLHPDGAALALATRAEAKLGLEAFASLIGVDKDLYAKAEAGELPSAVVADLLSG